MLPLALAVLALSAGADALYSSGGAVSVLDGSASLRKALSAGPAMVEFYAPCTRPWRHRVL